MAGPRSVASALSSLLLFVNLCTCVARLGLGRSGGYSSNIPHQGSGFEGPRNPTSRCEPIEIALCRDIGYNLTSMPNLLGDVAQVEAAVHLREFATLIELRCHEHVRFFLCSVFAPMCTEQVSQVIPACRPMCEHTRDSCAPIMRKFSFGWPESLRCDRLPTKHDPNALCMEAPVDPSEREPSSGRRFTAGLPLGTGTGDAESRPSPGATCPNPGKMAWAPRSGRCAPRCLPGVDYLWTSSDRVLARAWLLPLSSLCLASCIFTLLTFLLDPTRFGYPGRPVAFLAASYAVHAATFLGALAAGAERVSCELAPDGSLYRIQDGGLDSPVCTAIFLLHYTSGMASSLWWLLLSLAWYLAAGCKWGHEAIMACSTYFHLLAWGLPALLSCLALALGHVSGDELTGLCRVAGAPVPGHTAAFLSVAPLALCLVLGSSLLAAGFVSLFRIRRAVRASGRATAPLDKLMARLGVYAFLHTLPATGLLTCAAYEVILGTSWAQRAATEPCNDNNCSLDHSIPHIEAFLLKSVLELGVGVTSGVWVWSSKTLLAWGRLCTRCCGLTKPVQGKVVSGSKVRNGSTAECAIWLDSDRAGFV